MGEAGWVVEKKMIELIDISSILIKVCGINACNYQ